MRANTSMALKAPRDRKSSFTVEDRSIIYESVHKTTITISGLAVSHISDSYAGFEAHAGHVALSRVETMVRVEEMVASISPTCCWVTTREDHPYNSN